MTGTAVETYKKKKKKKLMTDQSSTSPWKTASNQTSFIIQTPSFFFTDVQLKPSNIKIKKYSRPVQLEMIFCQRRYASTAGCSEVHVLQSQQGVFRDTRNKSMM